MSNLFEDRLRSYGERLLSTPETDIEARNDLILSIVQTCRVRVRRVGEEAWNEIDRVLYGYSDGGMMLFEDGVRAKIFERIGEDGRVAGPNSAPRSGRQTRPSPANQDQIVTLPPASRSSGVRGSGKDGAKKVKSLEELVEEAVGKKN